MFDRILSLYLFTSLIYFLIYKLNEVGTILNIIAGLILGVVIGYLIIRQMYKKSYRSKTEEMNKKADLVVQEARLAAKRILDEADMKSDRKSTRLNSSHVAISYA